MDRGLPRRPDLIAVLGQLADAALLESDGSENEGLAANAALLGALSSGSFAEA